MEPGAVPAEELKQGFPKIDLPIKPPYPPMEAKSVDEIPHGDAWLYEPKWDGFRCLAFRSGDAVLLQSKAGQPLGRYFPELIDELKQLSQKKFVLDGEIVIFQGKHLSFDDLLMRFIPPRAAYASWRKRRLQVCSSSIWWWTNKADRSWRRSCGGGAEAGDVLRECS